MAKHWDSFLSYCTLQKIPWQSDLADNRDRPWAWGQKTRGVLTLAYHMSQSEQLQIITGTDAPQTLAHLGGQVNLIAQVPFPSPNYNHSTSPYARPSDFKDNRHYWTWIKTMKKSIKEDDSINIPNHFTQFFSYIKFYWKVFLGEISATKPSEPTPTITPIVSQQDIIMAIRYEAVPIDPFLIVQCILQ